MFSFTFKDQNSYSDFGIVITKKPNIPIPQRNVEYIKIPGRNGSLAIDDGTYDNILIPIDCSFKNKAFKDKVYEIITWLTGEQGKLIFSDDDEKYYIGQVVNSYDIIPSIKNFGQFTVGFNCQPLKYSTYSNKITITTPKTLYNEGTEYSEPILKIFGTGNVSVTLNGNTFLITDLIDYVTVDTTLQDCYRENILFNNKMSGEFPIFQVGKNDISWTGNITKIEITRNLRWL